MQATWHGNGGSSLSSPPCFPGRGTMTEEPGGGGKFDTCRIRASYKLAPTLTTNPARRTPHMKWPFHPALLLLLVALFLGAMALWLLPGGGAGRALPLPLPDGDREIAWLDPAT